MRFSTKQIDDIFVKCQGLFGEPFKLACVWHKSRESDVLGSWGEIRIAGGDGTQGLEGYDIHYIGINLWHHRTEKAIYETFLHELIHAWCYEHDLDPMGHGYHFMKWAHYFSQVNENYQLWTIDCNMELAHDIDNFTKDFGFAKLLAFAQELDVETEVIYA